MMFSTKAKLSTWLECGPETKRSSSGRISEIVFMSSGGLLARGLADFREGGIYQFPFNVLDEDAALGKFGSQSRDEYAKGVV